MVGRVDQRMSSYLGSCGRWWFPCSGSIRRQDTRGPSWPQFLGAVELTTFADVEYPHSRPIQRPDSTTRGEMSRVHRLSILGAALLFSAGGTAIKATTLSSWQVASFRSGVAALFLLLAIPRARHFWSIRTLGVGVVYAATTDSLRGGQQADHGGPGWLLSTVC